MPYKLALFTLLFLVSGLMNASAQTPTPTPEESKTRPRGFIIADSSPTYSEGKISKGVVNNSAISLPKPVYPKAARDARASGAVNVQVLIDEQGNVISASTVSGHPLLRAVSEQAALQSKFKPTLLSGQPVKVNGVIVYNFVPPPPIIEKTEWLRRSTFLASLKGNWQPLSGQLVTDFSKAYFNENFSYENELLLSIPQKPEERAEIVDKIISSLKTKLTPTEIWQLELGAAMMETTLEVRNKLSNPAHQFNESKVRSNLNKIRDLSSSAPNETPTELLDALKPIIEISDSQNLQASETLNKLIQNLGQTIRMVLPTK